MSYKRVIAKARKRDGIPIGPSYTGSGDELGRKDRERNRKEERRKHRQTEGHRKNGSREKRRDRVKDKVAAESMG